jgi:hypothetical protein
VKTPLIRRHAVERDGFSSWLRKPAPGYLAIRMATRDERCADNQRRFNAANESLGELVKERMPADARIPFLCECADERCLGRVELSLDEFEHLHESEDVFVIVPGHPRVNGEVILQRQERFEQVEKTNE